MGRTAIILGATGLVGGNLLEKLLEDPRYDNIHSFSRSASKFQHPKFTETIADLLSLENHAEEFRGDVVFCCIGTTKSKTPNKQRYAEIDKGIPVTAATLAKQNQIGTLIIISALGADSESRIFYNRIKGEMEDGVKAQQLPKLHLVRPSLIIGSRQESRTVESIAQSVLKVASPLMIGFLSPYRPIEANTIAEAMIWLDTHKYQPTIVESETLKKLVN